MLVNSLASQAFDGLTVSAPGRHYGSLSADIARTTTICVVVNMRYGRGSCAPDEIPRTVDGVDRARPNGSHWTMLGPMAATVPQARGQVPCWLRECRRKAGTAGRPDECIVALATGGHTRHLLLCRWGYSGPIVLKT